MNGNPSVLKRTYDALAFFAVLNVFVVGGIAAYLLGTGVIDGEKVQEMVAVLRVDEEAADADEAASSEEAAESVDAPTAVAASPVVGMTSEIMRREAERIKVELDQKVALANSILLRVETEREAFRREREAATTQRKARKTEEQSAGFAKQVELYESLSPKVAIGHMLGLDDPEEAARLLIAMDTRKAKKIVESAKLPDQMKKMQEIVSRMKAVSPVRSNEIASN